jgi:hypothetical protein
MHSVFTSCVDRGRGRLGLSTVVLADVNGCGLVDAGQRSMARLNEAAAIASSGRVWVTTNATRIGICPQLSDCAMVTIAQCRWCYRDMGRGVATVRLPFEFGVSEVCITLLSAL